MNSKVLCLSKELLLLVHLQKYIQRGLGTHAEEASAGSQGSN